MSDDAEVLRIQITELLRMEFDIQEDIQRLEKDLAKVRDERTLRETQLKLIEQKELGQLEE